MLQKILLKLVLPFCLDAIINICETLSVKTDNTIDDSLVKTLKENKELIIATAGII